MWRNASVLATRLAALAAVSWSNAVMLARDDGRVRIETAECGRRSGAGENDAYADAPGEGVRGGW